MLILTGNNLLLQGDNTNGYIRTTNSSSLLFLGTTGNAEAIIISSSSATITTELGLTGNFNIFQSSYTQPLGSYTQLGYTNTNSSTDTITTTAKNLVSITLPAPGVWLVEGQLLADFSNTSIYYFGLSTYSVFFDDTRYNIMPLQIGTATTFASRITSVFTVTNSTTVIYLIGQLSGGGPTSNDKHFMSYTRIG